MTGKARPDITTKSEDEQQALTVWCQGDDVLVMFLWAKSLAADPIRVQYRFGESEAVDKRWRSTHQAGVPRGKDLTEFLNLVRAHTTVLMRVVDSDGESITSRFDITGSAEAMQLLPCLASRSTAAQR